mmetsp:Transcript_26939/g.41763  ORF Transcript_26939/g.41763 Transcript_26939/m.41763 type:complete len:231 (-) Transcript_26939:480-1172(-)
MQRQNWNHRTQIGITRPFTDSIHRPLNHAGTGLTATYTIGHCHTAIIVHMDAYSHAIDTCHVTSETIHHNLGNLLNLPRHRATICVAQDQGISTSINSYSTTLHCVFRVVFVAIIEMLQIYKYSPTLFYQVSHTIPNHIQIVFWRCTQYLGHLPFMSLRHHTDCICTRLYQSFDLSILFNFCVLATSASECNQFLPYLWRELHLGFLEEFKVLRIRSRPPALNIVHPKFS